MVLAMAAKFALIIACAVMGAWMVFDGAHHMITGDYVRMNGQLGPWANLVEAAGWSPDTLWPFFLALGAAWLATAVSLARGSRSARKAALLLALLSLPYLIIGTLLALIVLLALLVQRRSHH
jgi:hypothetical protein